MIHDFRDQLAYSEDDRDETIWLDFYRSVWPNLVKCSRVRGACDDQRAGIDRVVELPGGKQFLIDEKKRRIATSDILLEEWSVYYAEGDPRNHVGWALDAKKRCDYIAYAVVPSQVCYLLPFELLRQAFMVRRSEWSRKYRLSPTPNKGYVTLNVAVPFAVLKEAVWAHCRFDWGVS